MGASEKGPIPRNPVMVPCVGVAPAIANAVYDAIGVRPTRLPLTPDVVLEAIQRRRASERGP